LDNATQSLLRRPEESIAVGIRIFWRADRGPKSSRRGDRRQENPSQRDILSVPIQGVDAPIYSCRCAQAAAGEGCMKRLVVLIAVFCIWMRAACAGRSGACGCESVRRGKSPASFDGSWCASRARWWRLRRVHHQGCYRSNCGYQVNGIWLSITRIEGKSGPCDRDGAAGAQLCRTLKLLSHAVTLEKSRTSSSSTRCFRSRTEGADMCLGCARYEVTARWWAPGRRGRCIDQARCLRQDCWLWRIRQHERLSARWCCNRVGRGSEGS